MVIMFVLLLIILEGGGSEGCLDQERFALLRLKLFFDDPFNSLHHWVDDEGATDCCQWERVECSNTTGRVIQLDLSFIGNWDLKERYLNASLFTPFQQLESLYLEYNNIAGCVENEGIERLSRLSNLKMLDLSENLFNNSILSSVAHLSSLTSLYLYSNRLEGNIDVKELDSLRDLEELYIGWNMIDKFVVPKGYRGLRKLKSLGLSGVGITNGSKLLQSMGSFPSLNTLHLSFNEFTETVTTTTQELHNFTNLEYLTLDYSSLHISLLQSIASFTSLKNLSMSYCEVNGVLSGQEFDSLSNLEELDMSGNEIDNFEVPQGYKGLRKLKTLYLLGVGIRDGSKLLQSMGSFPSLNNLDLSYNNFTDTVTTTQELHNFANLEYLTLHGSSLHISFLQSIALMFPSLKNLSMLDCKVNGVVLIVRGG
ncbi:hypothetical protein CUMW_258990 [Citrus unshiu]|nr:hypothetical protein CUMW_258990 [Citrus unshiu]